MLCVCLGWVSCACRSFVMLVDYGRSLIWKSSVTLVSILRLNSLIHFASTDNLTCELPFLFSLDFLSTNNFAQGDYVTIGYWSTIECDVGVICACLPAIRSLLRQAAPGIFGDTEQTKSYGMNSHTRGNSRLDGSVYIQGKGESRQFYPLGDIETSSQAHLHQRA